MLISIIKILIKCGPASYLNHFRAIKDFLKFKIYCHILESTLNRAIFHFSANCNKEEELIASKFESKLLLVTSDQTIKSAKKSVTQNKVIN